MRFPSIDDVAKGLQKINADVEGECDVRLQVYSDGQWALRRGLSDYDSDHHGYWGASSVPGVVRGRVRRFNSRALARYLIDQAREHYHTMKERERDLATAMVFLDTWGSTSVPPQRWHGLDYAETDYTPDWSGIEGSGRVTALVYASDGNLARHCPAGWRVRAVYQCGERECPECEATGQCGNVPCLLCEGNRYLYWGEDWAAVVFERLEDSDG